MQTLNQLKHRAKKHGFEIRKVRGGEYMIVDEKINGVVSYPAELPLEGVEKWLDEYEKQNPVD